MTLLGQSGCAIPVSVAAAVYADKVSECSGQRFLWHLSSRAHSDCCEKHWGATKGCRLSNSTISAETQKSCLILEGETEIERERDGLCLKLYSADLLSTWASDYINSPNQNGTLHDDLLNWYSSFCLIYIKTLFVHLKLECVTAFFLICSDQSTCTTLSFRMLKRQWEAIKTDINAFPLKVNIHMLSLIKVTLSRALLFTQNLF